MYGKDRCPFEMAITALEEIQEYRKLGTVEVVGQAVEKTKEKKCVKESCPDHVHYKCPTCGKIQMSEYIYGAHGTHRMGRITKNCEECGQKLEGFKEYGEYELREENTSSMERG